LSLRVSLDPSWRWRVCEDAYLTSLSERLTITPERLSSPDAQLLIARLNAELCERYPKPEDRHFELAEAQVSKGRGVFVVARLDGDAVGCGALRQLDRVTGELKRMYVARDARGHGVGGRLLAELERHARLLGLRRLVLETGERQHEAMGLYTGAGFERIHCFGEYADSPVSVCMEKSLD
jgi:GNAT superfamily N-acetyltransferase